jgi:hypothetical protein
MKQPYKNLPVYIIENWQQTSQEKIDELIPIILKNKETNSVPGGASFWVTEDPTKDFSRLYGDFVSTLSTKVDFHITYDNIAYCNVYYSTDTNFAEVLDPHGRVYYHNHKHVQYDAKGSPTTLAGVYYMNVPDENSGSIEFRRVKQKQSDGSYKYLDEDTRYHMMSKEPLEPYQGLKETIMEEFWYQPKNGDLVLFPAFLEHRPHRTLKPNGHRIAVNFELKTKESVFNIVEQLNTSANNIK